MPDQHCRAAYIDDCECQACQQRRLYEHKHAECASLKAELAAARIEIEKLRYGTVKQYGCHCDLEPGMAPDSCVIDAGRYLDCIYAQEGMKKEQCKYWKPIELTRSPREQLP